MKGEKGKRPVSGVPFPRTQCLHTVSQHPGSRTTSPPPPSSRSPQLKPSAHFPLPSRLPCTAPLTQFTQPPCSARRGDRPPGAHLIPHLCEQPLRGDGVRGGVGGLHLAVADPGGRRGGEWRGEERRGSTLSREIRVNRFPLALLPDGPDEPCLHTLRLQHHLLIPRRR